MVRLLILWAAAIDLGVYDWRCSTQGHWVIGGLLGLGAVGAISAMVLVRSA
jgi:hypothetical protein